MEYSRVSDDFPQAWGQPAGWTGECTGDNTGYSGTGGLIGSDPNDRRQQSALTQSDGHTAEPSRLTKHLDPSRGQYYFYDHDTQETTWDSPVKHVPLYFSDQQVQDIAVMHESIVATKARERGERLEIIEAMMEDRQLAKAKEDADLIAQKNRNSVNDWSSGLLIAANENYDCNMSWKDIPRIEPIVYDFEKNFGHRLRALRLVGVKLTEIPDALGPNLPGLEVLNVSNNSLRTLPDSIVYMTSLTQLSVLHNELESLPRRIGLLCNMRRLEIANNRLGSLPDTFAALTHIKRLDLEGNRLRLLPENLDLMVKLETLNVNKNRLLRLPRCLHRMPVLSVVMANKNCITYIPNDIIRSRSIETLSLCNNELTMLPERLGEMICLKELALDFNRLSFLPMTFYLLENLTRLRIEGNPALCSPGDDIITKGAKSVVAWCRMRFLDDQQSRMRRIIFTVQDTLRQQHERGLSDLKSFDDEFYWKEDICYAFSMDWFFAYVVPLMNKTWAREASRTRNAERRADVKALALRGNSAASGDTNASPVKKRDFVDDTIINDFPFTRAEVMWALTHYFDANGPVYTQGKAFFKRCGCVDTNGRRFPCVPPKKGYMCHARAFVLKKQIVLLKERERRLWEKMKKTAILEAGLRAEQESVQWLESDAGRLWVAEMSYAQGENKIEDLGLDSIVKRRREQCEKKKNALIKKFDKHKAVIKSKLDSKTVALRKQLDDAKELLKTAKEGYIKEATTNRIVLLSDEMASFPEHDQLISLQDECMYKCQLIEDEFFKASSEEEETATAGEESAEESFWETPEEKQERIEREEREVKALAIRTAGQETGGQTKNDRENQRKAERVARKELKKKRDDEKRQRRAKMMARMKRQYKYLVDRVHLKYSYLKLLANGEFSEAQKELQYHIFQEYVNNNVAKARRAAEREYFVMGKIRRQWGGLGLETSFYQWKDYVKLVRSERRKDARRKWRQDVKNFESAMICVHLAEAQISLWHKSTDIYTDTPYWKQWQSGDVMWEEPKLETYMPLGFKFPDPPAPLPDGVGEDTTEPSEDDMENDSDDGLDFLAVMKADDVRVATAGSKEDDVDALKGRSRKTPSRNNSRRRQRKLGREDDVGNKDLAQVSLLGSESMDIPADATVAQSRRRHKGRHRSKNDEADLWVNDRENNPREDGKSSDSESVDSSRSSGGSGSSGSASRESLEESKDSEGDVDKGVVSPRSQSSVKSASRLQSFDSANERPLLLRVDSGVSSIPDQEDVDRDAYSNALMPRYHDLHHEDEISTPSSHHGDAKSPPKGIGMDGSFQPRRWPFGGRAEASFAKSVSFGAATLDPSTPVKSVHSDASAKKVMFSPLVSKSLDSSDGPFGSVVQSAGSKVPLSDRKVVIAPINDLGIYILPGAGRMQVYGQDFSYGPDSLRAGVISGRVGRPTFQEEVVETEEEKKRRIMRERTAEAARNAASTATLMSSLSDANKEREKKFDSGNAQEMLDALEGGSDVSETAARARLAEIRSQINNKHRVEIDRAKIALKQKEQDVNVVRHQTYMKQRNRRPRMNQGLFDPRVKKEKEAKYFEPASTFALLNMAGGSYDMTRQSPMEVMTALATRAVKIKKKLRESAEAENLIPKKDTDFYHDHIDVIVRENYISSDSEEEELARKIKTARLRTANKGSQQGTGRLDTSPSRSGSAGMNASTGGAGTLKLPSIQSR